MSSTLTTYRTAVKLRGFDALPDATVDEAVQEARRRVITARRWSWSEVSDATLSTAGNTATVSLASITGLGYLDAVRISDSSGELPLDYRPYSIIRDLQQRCALTGTPQFWTRRAGNLVFYPTPSRVLAVTLEYIARPADLAVSPAACIIPEAHRDLVTWAAAVPLKFRQNDLVASSAADQYYTKVLLPEHARQDAAEQRQTSTQIRTGWFGDR